MSLKFTGGRKINLAIVENNLAIGGSQKLAVDLLANLDREIFNLYLVTLGQPERGDLYDRIPGDVTVIKLNFKGMWDVPSLISLARVFWRIKPDIVKSAIFFSNTFVRVLKPFFRYECITAEHNTKNNKTAIQKLINHSLSHLSYTIVTDSKMVADFLSSSEGTKRDRFSVIPNGVDMQKVEETIANFTPKKAELLSALSLPPGKKIFLNVARLVKQKNHFLLLRSFSELQKLSKEAVLIIIGGGTLEAELRKLAKELLIEDSVFFLGEQKDIYKYYLLSDCGVMTSTDEGFSVAAIEGLAFGVPLISTRVAGVVEYLVDGENGYLTEHDPIDIAHKMKLIIDRSPEEVSVMSRYSKETGKKYSIERYIKTYTELFLKVSESHLKNG
jgi:glycosyltransferase involved in cell wall biosynthesis